MPTRLTPPPVTRRYTQDDQYIADARQMAAAGWYVTATRREPDNTIIATYRVTTPQRAGHSVGWRRVARTLDHTALMIGAGIGAALLLLLLVALLLSEMPAVGASDAVASATPTAGLSTVAYATAYAATAQAIHSPPATVTATVTAAPSPVTGARLGSTLDAFTAIFGPAYTSGATSATWDITISGQQLQVYAEQWQGTSHLWTVALSYLNPSPPSASQNAAICQQFLPSDATHTRDDPSYQPTEHIYQSQRLAASLPADAFQNNAGAAVPPGTFAVWYDTRSCAIATGEN